MEKEVTNAVNASDQYSSFGNKLLAGEIKKMC